MKKNLLASILAAFLSASAFAQTPGGSLGIAVDPSGHLAFLQVSALGHVLASGSGRGLAMIVPGGQTGVALDPNGKYAFLHVGADGGLIVDGAGGGGSPGGSPNSIQYNAAGSFGGITVVNNAVLVTNSSGVPSEATTLPTGLTIPGATLTTASVNGITLSSTSFDAYGAAAAVTPTTLGLVIGTNVQAYNANLTTWAGKTAPSGTVVGTSDSQALTNKTVNGLTLAAQTTGFTVAGGTTSKTLTVAANINTGTSDGTLASGAFAAAYVSPLTLTSLSTGFSVAGGTTSKTLTVAANVNTGTTDMTLGTAASHAATDFAVYNAAITIAGTSTALGGSITANAIDAVGAAPSNGNYLGPTITYLNSGGSSLTFGEAVTYNSSSNFVAADCSTPTVARGLSVAAVSSSSPATVMTRGVATNSGWSWTVGGVIYLSTAGALTQTAPSTSGYIIQQVGIALSSTTAFFDFTNEYLTHS